MTYAEKLKDPRWLAFRADFISSRKHDRNAAECDDCGEDTQGPLHVHHRLYKRGKEPWEYEDEDLRLICADCHERIHATEHRVRALVLRCAPHECYEFNDLLTELETALQNGRIKSSLAHAKNAVRRLQCAGEAIA